MSGFFTNPFAGSNAPPIFASSSLHPLPTAGSFPVPASVRRASQVRLATPPTPPCEPSGLMAAAAPTASPVPSFTSPFTKQRTGSPSNAGPGHTPSSPRPTARKNSSASSGRSHSHSRAMSSELDYSPGPGRRGSGQGAQSPSAMPAHALPFFNQLQVPTGKDLIEKHLPDYSRRKSVDVGVLGVHRLSGGSHLSKRVRDAVGPDAGDKEVGVVGAGVKGGKDRLLGRHLASLLAHSLALCADPKPSDVSQDQDDRLAAISGSPSTSPFPSRNTSVSMDSTASSLDTSSVPPISPAYEPILPPMPIHTPAPVFPVLSEAKRFRLIGNLQSWSFNAMGYSSDELLACVGIIFESVRNMAGVDFDLAQFKMLLLSLRSAYHARNGYHNFSHAADVTQACYSFLVRMGLAPPLYLLCEDDYDPNLGEGRRKWRRNRAVEEGGMGELLRPMDVFPLMVAAIGHDVGHPGLSNAYMVNARAPVAQIYHDKSVLENFHTVTLIHMLRKHNFDYLLGGDFGHLGDQATSFRKVLEASILATDMSQHFSFVTQLNEMGRRFGDKRLSSSVDVEADRLLLCAGLMKCADISNSTRPHRISRAWSTALLNEWTVQAAIETEFGLPVSVMTLDPSDTKAQAKSQVGFIDLFAKPLFTAMAGVVDEFHDFAEKLRDGRIAWEAISLQTDEAFSKPITSDWKLSPAPVGRSNSRGSSYSAAGNESESETPDTPTMNSTSVVTPTAPPGQTTSVASTTSRGRPKPIALHHSYRRHGRTNSGGSTSSTIASPLSPAFSGSASSAATNTASSFSSTSHAMSDTVSLFSPRYSASATGLAAQDALALGKSICGGACSAATAMCEVCSKRENVRRGSLGRVLAGIQRGEEEELAEDEDDGADLLLDDPDVWPPHPFQPTRPHPTAELPASAP